MIGIAIRAPTLSGAARTRVNRRQRILRERLRLPIQFRRARSCAPALFAYSGVLRQQRLYASSSVSTR